MVRRSIIEGDQKIFMYIVIIIDKSRAAIEHAAGGVRAERAGKSKPAAAATRQAAAPRKGASKKPRR